MWKHGSFSMETWMTTGWGSDVHRDVREVRRPANWSVGTAKQIMECTDTAQCKIMSCKRNLVPLHMTTHFGNTPAYRTTASVSLMIIIRAYRTTASASLMIIIHAYWTAVSASVMNDYHTCVHRTTRYNSHCSSLTWQFLFGQVCHSVPKLTVSYNNTSHVLYQYIMCMYSSHRITIQCGNILCGYQVNMELCWYCYIIINVKHPFQQNIDYINCVANAVFNR